MRTPLAELIIHALENDGPMTPGMLREVVIELNGERYVEQAAFDAEVAILISENRIREVPHSDAEYKIEVHS